MIPQSCEMGFEEATDEIMLHRLSSSNLYIHDIIHRISVLEFPP